MADIQPRERPLGRRRETFVELMLSDPSMTQSRAAELAGYRHPYVAGAKLMRQPAVARRLRGRVESLAMQADEMLARMADFARADITEFFDCFLERPIFDEEGAEVGVARLLDLEKVRRKRLGHLIKRITPSKHGDIVELHDAQKALETLMRQAGLMNQVKRVEVTTEDVRRVEVALANPEMPVEELEQLRDRLRAQSRGRALPAP